MFMCERTEQHCRRLTSTVSFFSTSTALPLTLSHTFLIPIVSPPTHTQYSAWKAVEGVRGLSVTTGGCAGKQVGDPCGETQEECGTEGKFEYHCEVIVGKPGNGNDLTCFKPKVECVTTCDCSGFTWQVGVGHFYEVQEEEMNHPGVRGLAVTTGGCAGKQVGDPCGETQEECGTEGTYKYECVEIDGKPGNDLQCSRPKVECVGTGCLCTTGWELL